MKAKKSLIRLTQAALIASSVLTLVGCAGPKTPTSTGSTDDSELTSANPLFYSVKSASGEDVAPDLHGGFNAPYAQQWGVAYDVQVAGDYDGDHRADLAVVRYVARKSTTLGRYEFDLQWHIRQSSNGAHVQHKFGERVFGSGLYVEDRPIPADYDGDGKVDPALFRTEPGRAQFRILNSSTGTVSTIEFAVDDHHDAQPMIGDYDGDGRADCGIVQTDRGGGYEPPVAPLRWRYYSSRTNALVSFEWGKSGGYNAQTFDVPMLGDFDGDGKADPVVVRYSTAIADTQLQWYIRQSTTGQMRVEYFGNNRMRLPASLVDFDGDRKIDLAAFAQESVKLESGEIIQQKIWHIASSLTGQYKLGIHWGYAFGDADAAADYDGDGKADIMVFRSSGPGIYGCPSGGGCGGTGGGGFPTTSTPSPLPADTGYWYFMSGDSLFR